METPRIFVTTYKAYNEGRQFARGQWVDLDDYPDHDDLIAHCAESVGETDPEFMVTDYEGFPRAWYSESGLPTAETLEMILGYASLKGDELEAFDAYSKLFDIHNMDSWDEVYEDFTDRHAGKFDNDERFAEDVVNESGLLDGIPETVANYFDFESYANDLILGGDFCSEKGHYFRNN